MGLDEYMPCHRIDVVLGRFDVVRRVVDDGLLCTAEAACAIRHLARTEAVRHVAVDDVRDNFRKGKRKFNELKDDIVDTVKEKVEAFS